MKLRADQWMMLGVSALGLYAIYRLAQASGGSGSSDLPVRDKPLPLPPSVPILPPGPRPPSAALPLQPGPVPPAPQELSTVDLSAQRMRLTPGSWYHGRLETDPHDPEASSRDIIKAALERIGFGQVQVFMTPEEAALDIHQPFALTNPGQGTRWFRARMPAFNQDTGAPIDPNLVKPATLIVLWRASAPAVTAGVSNAQRVTL